MPRCVSQFISRQADHWIKECFDKPPAALRSLPPRPNQLCPTEAALSFQSVSSKVFATYELLKMKNKNRNGFHNLTFFQMLHKLCKKSRRRYFTNQTQKVLSIMQGWENLFVHFDRRQGLFRWKRAFQSSPLIYPFRVFSRRSEERSRPAWRGPRSPPVPAGPCGTWPGWGQQSPQPPQSASCKS